MDPFDFFINNEDCKFFEELPSDEQILFTYDLVCEEFYGKGSIDEEEKSNLDIENFQDFLDTLSDRLINTELDISIIQLNNYLVFNTEQKGLIQSTVLEYFQLGYILSRIDMSQKVTMLFHKQRYCEMYYIIGKTNKMILN
jgi:hypothetical protein